MQIFISRIAHSKKWKRGEIVKELIFKGLPRADAEAYVTFLFADKEDPPGCPMNPVEEGILTKVQWERLELSDAQNRLHDRWVLNYNLLN